MKHNKRDDEMNTHLNTSCNWINCSKEPSTKQLINDYMLLSSTEVNQDYYI